MYFFNFIRTAFLVLLVNSEISLRLKNRAINVVVRKNYEYYLLGDCLSNQHF